VGHSNERGEKERAIGGGRRGGNSMVLIKENLGETSKGSERKRGCSIVTLRGWWEKKV